MISKTAPNTRVQDFRRGIGHPRSPSEVINHHAPPTPRSTQPTGLFKRLLNKWIGSKEQFIQKELQTVRGTFYRRIFGGEGATENFRAVLN